MRSRRVEVKSKGTIMTLSDINQPALLSLLQFHSQRRAAEDSLLEFTKQSWNVVEPSPLDINWHVECLCEHLAAVANQQCLRLLINLPPRHMKSLVANVFFPAWVWANRPRKDLNGAPTNEEGWFGAGGKVPARHLSAGLDHARQHQMPALDRVAMVSCVLR